MSEQIRILKMIEDGEITTEEGTRLLLEIDQSPDTPETKTSFLKILEQIENGDLSTDEGIDQLNDAFITPQAGTETPHTGEHAEPRKPPKISDDELNRWKQWWTYPMYLGIGIVALSTLWMNSAQQNSGYGFWFFCSWLPLALGILLISLSWMSQKGPWIHVRVRGDKDNVAVSMPAPLGLLGWGLRTFGHYIPHMDRTSIDEIITALDQNVKSDTPLYINVDEGDGEHVEIFIG